MRGESRGVRHWHGCSAQRPLERPPEISMAGETGPATLGVLHPQPLHRRWVLLGLGARPRRGHEPRLATAAQELATPGQESDQCGVLDNHRRPGHSRIRPMRTFRNTLTDVCALTTHWRLVEVGGVLVAVRGGQLLERLILYVQG